MKPALLLGMALALGAAGQSAAPQPDPGIVQPLQAAARAAALQWPPAARVALQARIAEGENAATADWRLAYAQAIALPPGADSDAVKQAIEPEAFAHLIDGAPPEQIMALARRADAGRDQVYPLALQAIKRSMPRGGKVPPDALLAFLAEERAAMGTLPPAAAPQAPSAAPARDDAALLALLDDADHFLGYEEVGSAEPTSTERDAALASLDQAAALLRRHPGYWTRDPVDVVGIAQGYAALDAPSDARRWVAITLDQLMPQLVALDAQYAALGSDSARVAWLWRFLAPSSPATTPRQDPAQALAALAAVNGDAWNAVLARVQASRSALKPLLLAELAARAN